MVRWLGPVLLGSTATSPSMVVTAGDGSRLEAVLAADEWRLRVRPPEGEPVAATLPARSTARLLFSAFDHHGHAFVDLWCDAEGLHYRLRNRDVRAELSCPGTPILEQTEAVREQPQTQELRCSFCNKNRSQVKQLIAGPNVYICSDCIAISAELIGS